MNNATPAPLAAPGPALHPARALATCVDGILATMLRFLARLGFLGRLINPQAAHLAHLLQSLSTLLARFAAGDLPPPAPCSRQRRTAPPPPPPANAADPHPSARAHPPEASPVPVGARPAVPAAPHAPASCSGPHAPGLAVSRLHILIALPGQPVMHRGRPGARQHSPTPCSRASRFAAHPASHRRVIQNSLSQPQRLVTPILLRYRNIITSPPRNCPACCGAA